MNAIHYQRLLPEADTAPLLSLYRRSIASVDDGFYSAAQRHAWTQWAVDAAGADAQLRQGLTVVALADGSSVGFAQLCPAHLVNMLYVDDSWQRQGIGRTLVTQLETVARQSGIATLSTRASDVSQPLFRSLGFEPVRREQIRGTRGVTLMRTLMHKPLHRHSDQRP
ncbi:GNAT family N-acetyltransferase [Halospina sp. K52047b]|uniref:GNAT family N-acetyltransferase n=1 Tax=Halospina sp. K52047b TaxID=2614160 RepID=UPI00124A8770|nr:GNAT family N-acetyltransferase [Halospina sp. K52047b]KAA8977085.1 GNAT family N-acetyltransferase [Halospina sp. K52047b]